MKRMKFGSIFTMFLGLVALMSGLAGCEDKITEGEIPVDNEKLVTVPLAFDFATETDGYEIASGRCVKTKAHLLFLYLNVFFLYATLFSLIW